MRLRSNLKSRQRGAVAIVVGVGLTLLIGMLAMVIDLGHLYVARTELQNGADAAALAGVAELNGKADGVANAVAKAQQVSNRNFYDFGNTRIFDTGDAETQNDSLEMWVGSSANDSDMVPVASVTSDAAAAGRFFFKVSTGKRDMVAWFASIWNILHVSTGGVAVAGRSHVSITPLAICALDVSKCASPVGTCTTPPCECGYEKGKAYDTAQVNNVVGGINPGTIYWIDALAKTASCTLTSTNDGRPYVCQGESAINTTVGSYVYTNTGNANPLLTALDSRFNDYPPQGQCEHETAPPDENIMEYRFDNPSVASWMNPAPTTQTATVAVSGVAVVANNGGVVWSFVRPESSPIAGRSINTPPYPAFPLTPNSDSGFVTAPTGGGAAFKKPNRRALNMVIVACPSSAGGNCRATPIAGIGQFFLQRKASSPASSQGVFVEFGGIVPNDPNLVTQYSLFR